MNQVLLEGIRVLQVRQRIDSLDERLIRKGSIV